MDLTIGAGTYGMPGTVINTPLSVEPTNISKEQYNSSKVAFSREIIDNLSKQDLPKLPEQNLREIAPYDYAIKTGARNLTDFIDLGYIKANGVDHSRRMLEQMLWSKPDYQQRGFFDMAKLYEEEYNRVKGLTDITEKDRDARLYVLDKAFLTTSRQGHSSEAANTGGVGRNFDTLANYAQNATDNIRASGLSQRTQGLMIQSLDKTLDFYKHKLMNEKISKALTQKEEHRGWGVTPRELKIISAQQYKKYKHYLDKINDILKNTVSTVSSADDIKILNTTSTVKKPVDESVSNSEESTNEEAPSEVSNPDEVVTPESSNLEGIPSEV